MLPNLSMLGHKNASLINPLPKSPNPEVEYFENFMGKRDNADQQHNLHLPQCFQRQILFIIDKCCNDAYLQFCHLAKLTFSQTTNFRIFQTDRVSNKYFKFDENSRQFSKLVGMTVGKRRNCSLQAISPFPLCFQMTCTADM